MEKVVIFGASAGARLIYSFLANDSRYHVAGFTVDRDYLKEQEMCKLPVVPFEEIEAIYPPGEYKMLVAVLAHRINKTRQEKYLQAKAKGYQFITYISPKATIWPGLTIGENCFIADLNRDRHKVYKLWRFNLRRYDVVNVITDSKHNSNTKHKSNGQKKFEQRFSHIIYGLDHLA